MNKTRQLVENAERVTVTHAQKKSVPETWKIVPLEAVLEDIVGGGTPSRGNPRYWIGAIPWLTVKDMRTRRPGDSIDHITKDAVRDSATNIVPADTVIIATRIGLGKVIRVPYDAAINQDLKALITKPNVDKSYLEYWICSIASYLESIGSGTTVKGIRLGHIRSLPFPLAPLDQQKRIVAEIEKQFSRLDEAVANLKRVKANLKRYKAAVLKAAVEGRLVETEASIARKKTPSPLAGEGGGEGVGYETGEQLLQRILETRRSQWKGKGKYKEPTAPDTTDLPELPEEWAWAAVEQLSLRVQYGHTASAVARKSGVRFLRITDIQDDHVDWSAVPSCDISAVEQRELRLQCGDIVFARTGATVGKSFQLKGQFPDSVFASYLIRISPHNVQTSDWLSVFFHSSEYWQQIRDSQAGIGQPNVNGTKLRRLAVPLPPLAEQTRIIAGVDRRLSLIEELEAAVTANLQRASRLRQSVLARAFTG